MYIQIGATWLTNPNDGTSQRVVTTARELKLDGQIVGQKAQLMRAVTETFFPRGNLSHTLTFKVTRRFTSIAAAFSFALTYRTTLPTSGTLTLVCGYPSEGQVTCQALGALLEGCSWDTGDTPGVSITHSYTIQCGAITVQSVAPAPLTDGAGTPLTDGHGTVLTSP